MLIQDVTGVHSGANPISGEFSVGATGLRISGGALGEPLREMTIASTIPEMLASVVAVGSDLRWFSSRGCAVDPDRRDDSRRRLSGRAQRTRTTTWWCPVAPSGNGWARSAVCVAPERSIARTASRWSPGVASQR